MLKFALILAVNARIHRREAATSSEVAVNCTAYDLLEDGCSGCQACIPCWIDPALPACDDVRLSFNI